MTKYLVQKGNKLLKITNSIIKAKRKAKVEHAQIYKRVNLKWEELN